MSLISLKKYVYEALNPDGKSVAEARLNILHAVYLTLTTGQKVNLIKGQQVFQIIVDQYSNEIQEVIPNIILL